MTRFPHALLCLIFSWLYALERARARVVSQGWSKARATGLVKEYVHGDKLINEAVKGVALTRLLSVHPRAVRTLVLDSDKHELGLFDSLNLAGFRDDLDVTVNGSSSNLTHTPFTRALKVLSHRLTELSVSASSAVLLLPLLPTLPRLTSLRIDFTLCELSLGHILRVHMTEPAAHVTRFSLVHSEQTSSLRRLREFMPGLTELEVRDCHDIRFYQLLRFTNLEVAKFKGLLYVNSKCLPAGLRELSLEHGRPRLRTEMARPPDLSSLRQLSIAYTLLPTNFPMDLSALESFTVQMDHDQVFQERPFPVAPRLVSLKAIFGVVTKADLWLVTGEALAANWVCGLIAGARRLRDLELESLVGCWTFPRAAVPTSLRSLTLRSVVITDLPNDIAQLRKHLPHMIVTQTSNQ